MSTITSLCDMFIKCTNSAFILFCIVCYRSYSLFGRVPYAAQSVIFITEEGTSYDTFSFILMSICLFWLSTKTWLHVVIVNRWSRNIAKSIHKTFYTPMWLWWEYSQMKDWEIKWTILWSAQKCNKIHTYPMSIRSGRWNFCIFCSSCSWISQFKGIPNIYC